MLNVRRASFVILATVLVSLILSCKPPETKPAAPPATTAVPTPAATAAPSPDEVAWEKVVAEAKKEGTVTLYSFAFTGDLAQVVAQAFQEKYGIKLEFVGGIGSVLIERIKSEHAGKKFLADTLDTSPALVAAAKRYGLTQSTGFLPILNEQAEMIGPPFQDAERHLLAMDAGFNAPYVNTQLVPASEEPKSYKDLLQPQWKGKMVWGDPSVDPVPSRLYAVMVPRKALDESFFTQLGKQDLRVASSVRDVAAILARGEAKLALGSSPSMNPLIASGAPIKPIDMVEGTIQLFVPIAMVKDAPHPNATRLFFNWLLSKEGQTLYVKAKGTIPWRKDVPDGTPPAGRLTPKVDVLSGVDAELETARLQTGGVISKLWGLQTK